MVKGVEPAAANEDPAPAPLTLKQRMAAIRAESFGIGKQDITMTPREGKAFTIKGHTVEGEIGRAHV